MATLRLKAIRSFTHSFIDWLEFFRTVFDVNLSSFRKDWLLRAEDPGACERKECLFHWHGLPRTVTALIDAEGGIEVRRENLTSFKLCFSLFLSSQLSGAWPHWGNRSSQQPPVTLALGSHCTLSFHFHNTSMSSIKTPILQLRKAGEEREVEACCTLVPALQVTRSTDPLQGLPTTLHFPPSILPLSWF